MKPSILLVILEISAGLFIRWCSGVPWERGPDMALFVFALVGLAAAAFCFGKALEE